jgi:hypothetical protein
LSFLLLMEIITSTSRDYGEDLKVRDCTL